MSDLAELIRHDAPRAYAGGAHYPFKHLLERKYRFVSRYGEEVALHRREGDDSVLPRALCPPGPNDQRTRGEPACFAQAPTPKPHQEKLYAEAFAFVDAGLSGLICAYTGFGKTPLAYAIAHRLGRKTLVVATKDDIYKQWIDGAVQFLGLSRNQVGEIRGDRVRVEGKPFVVAMIHSLAKDGRVPAALAAQFGLVIFDECHRVPADSFSVVAGMFPAYWRIGLSATIERSDGKDLLLQAHIGPLRAATEAQLMVPKVLRYTSSWQCPRVYRTEPETGERKVVRIAHEPGKTTHIEKLLAADPGRNRDLAELIFTAHQRGRRTVVFGTQHEHLHALHRAAHAMGVSTRDMGFYVGATTKAERAARDQASVRPVMLTTYGMCAEGTNLPWLDCAVLAIPRSQVEQPVGRIRREHPDKPDPVVIDLVDTDSPVFAGYAATRARWYARIGAAVKQMN